MGCELCGREGRMVISVVEGSQMQVCSECSRFGKFVKEVRTESRRVEKKVPVAEEPETVHIVAPDYAKQIKKAREGKGWTQEELAKKIAEKESLIQKVEQGNMQPSMKLINKFEKILGLDLTMEYKDDTKMDKSSDDSVFTIGDMIKIRKR